MRFSSVSICFFLALAAGCSSSQPQPVVSTDTRCAEPRPQVCTMEYAPVCASLVKGGRADYSSGCNACADDAVVAYVEGSCDAGPLAQGEH